jgi:LuxR family maltose regulon positive regulatory protein
VGQKPLFAPKFRLPVARPGLVDRPRLTQRLVRAAGPLVIIGAPAGFGKSTLLAQWEAADPRPFAFVSLEPSENDPLELWNCVILSIQQAAPSFANDLAALPPSVEGATIGPLMRRIAAELDQLAEPIVIVLDDYHVIDDPACHASVTALLAHPISRALLVVSTRADPAIPLGRLRASGELVEIRRSDLAFTAAETEKLVNDTKGSALSADGLEIIHRRTEGWAAGLELASLGLRESAHRDEFLRTFGGSNRHVFDYLTEVVLDSVDHDARRFLLETSILSELSGPLCDAVTGRADSAAVLDMLERSNLFTISLDDRRCWYRYHHLFGQLLGEQLQRLMPERVADLHRLASAWLAGTAHRAEAIEHAIAAGELETAADLVVSGWTSPMASGRLTAVLGWLEAFPGGYVAGSAPLSLISAWVNGLLGYHAAARRSIEDMLADGSPGPLPDGSGSVERAAALFQLLFAVRSDMDGLRSAAGSVREFRDELRPEFQAVAAFALGVAAFLEGNHEEAQAELQCAAQLAQELGAWIIVVDALGFAAQVALAQSRAEDARVLALSAIEQAREHALLELPHVGYYMATAGAAFARSGLLEEGDALLETGIRQLADWAPLLAAHARLMRAPLRRQLGDQDGARILLDEAKKQLAGCVSTGIIGDLVPQVARALSGSHRRGADWAELTDRELSVLRLLERGLSQRQIAGELFLSFHTIHSHTKSIYIRLGVTNRAEAIEQARELQLL